MTNYYKLRSFSPFSYSYMFLDCDDYLADQLFIKHKVPIKYETEFSKKNTKYRVICCKIRKRYEEAFKAALGEMYNKMLLRGYPDYESFCEEVGAAMAESGYESQAARQGGLFRGMNHRLLDEE